MEKYLGKMTKYLDEGAKYNGNAISTKYNNCKSLNQIIMQIVNANYDKGILLLQWI